MPKIPMSLIAEDREPIIDWLPVLSKKHPNEIFFKASGTDDFICKFYAGHEEEANLISRLLTEYMISKAAHEAYELEH